MKKLVLTGAAGRLGSKLREPLLKLADQLVSSDIVEDFGKLYEREIYVRADLAEYDEIYALLNGADMVVHFGAISDEAPFEAILRPNIIGAYNVWEAAYQNWVRRVVYASSIHAVGMHLRTDFIGTNAPHRPDSFYGLANCFAEDTAQLYWDKCGVEAVCLRILSCAQVTSEWALGDWLSTDDLIHLVERSIDSQITGCSIIYGVSNNDRASVDNTRVSFLGYRPKDNAERYAAEIIAEPPHPEVPNSAHLRHGGILTSVALGESSLTDVQIVTDSN